jgi:hypothetical protein
VKVSAEQVLNALRKQPELLWDVLAAVLLNPSLYRVAGGWEPCEPTDYSHDGAICKAVASYTPDGKRVAKVNVEPYAGHYFYWVFAPDRTDATGVSKNLAEAFNEAEHLLRDAGFLVVGREP